MGGIISKRATSRQPSFGSGSHSWSPQSYPEVPYAQPYAPPSQDYGQQQHFAPPPQSHGSAWPGSKKRLERKYSKIDDDYNSLEQVIELMQLQNIKSTVNFFYVVESLLLVRMYSTVVFKWNSSSQDVFSIYPSSLSEHEKKRLRAFLYSCHLFLKQI